MIEITDEPIDHARWTDRVRSPEAGAVCTFLGTTREVTGTRRTATLDYEAYGPMALRRLEALEQEARGRWPLIATAIVHRVGRVDPGEISVVVAVSSPHRCDAFEACAWLMDEIKRDVPIWKRESWTDGSREWVHPGIDPQSS
ncbi:MAG: molybdenum cofactor biosynthesis protein MoaE [Isosphaeraceae bacterium]